MLNLDWTTFQHFNDKYILGERTSEFILNHQKEKEIKWKEITKSWLKNSELFNKTIKNIASNNNNVTIEALIEDAMFENEILKNTTLH